MEGGVNGAPPCQPIIRWVKEGARRWGHAGRGDVHTEKRKTKSGRTGRVLGTVNHVGLRCEREDKKARRGFFQRHILRGSLGLLTKTSNMIKRKFDDAFLRASRNEFYQKRVFVDDQTGELHYSKSRIPSRRSETNSRMSFETFARCNRKKCREGAQNVWDRAMGAEGGGVGNSCTERKNQRAKCTEYEAVSTNGSSATYRKNKFHLGARQSKAVVIPRGEVGVSEGPEGKCAKDISEWREERRGDRNTTFRGEGGCLCKCPGRETTLEATP